MLTYLYGVYICTDGIINEGISVEKSEVVRHLKSVVENLKCKPDNLSNVVEYTDTVGKHPITYSFVEFGGRFLDYVIGEKRLLIQVTDRFITGLDNLIKQLNMGE